MNIGSLSDNEIRSMEAEISARRTSVDPTYQHYGPTENLSDNEIRSMEAEIAARRTSVDPTYQHYGPTENLSDNEIRSMEAEIAARRREIKPTYQHYGSIENIDNTEFLEHQVLEQRRKDMPYQEYLKDLIENPHITNPQQFEDAVVRSMESNRLMKSFTESIVEKISEATYAFRTIEKTDTVSIENHKQKLENLVNVYIKFLYELKRNDWTFGVERNIDLGMIDGDMLEDIWQVQRQFNITFNMPIPKNLGEDYGQAFEREGKMVPGITLMYDDLKGKEINWHQVLNYKENELTPQQRYVQRKEEAVRQFDLARQEELKSVLAYSHSQNDNSVKDQVDIPAIRK